MSKDNTELFKVFADINKVVSKSGSYLDKVYSNMDLPIQSKPKKTPAPQKQKIAA
ncbi:MAG TPA: hypothetical protein VIE91_08550 [Methylophilaceae bacterium]|jgi:hypothetical protein